MTISHGGAAVAAAFGLSGLGCLVGLGLLTDGSWWPERVIAMTLGGYFAAGAVALTARHQRLVSTLGWVWVAGVSAGLVWALIQPEVWSDGDGEVLAGVVMLLVYGTVVFGFWAAFALVGLTLARRNFWHESY